MMSGEGEGHTGGLHLPKKSKHRKGSKREKDSSAAQLALAGEGAPPTQQKAEDVGGEASGGGKHRSSSKRDKKATTGHHKRQKSKGSTVVSATGETSCSASTSSSPSSCSPSAASYTHQQHKSRREQLVEELLTSERAHVQNLNAFLHDYVIPLRDKKILSSEELQSLLCNLDLIRRWNVEFLNQLESALDDERGFGDIFLEMVRRGAPLTRRRGGSR